MVFRGKLPEMKGNKYWRMIMGEKGTNSVFFFFQLFSLAALGHLGGLQLHVVLYLLPW